ncbi:MAG: stage II sporulation protein P [Eubacteriales bacterium]
MDEEKIALLGAENTQKSEEAENKAEETEKNTADSPENTQAESGASHEQNNNVPSDEDGREQAGILLKRIFVSAMCLISLTAAVFCGVYVCRKFDISAGSIAGFVIKSVTGHDATVVSNAKAGESEVTPDTEKAKVQPETASEPNDSASVPNSRDEEYTVPYFQLSLTNETPYEPDMDEILSAERSIPPADELYAVYGEGEPLVLIIHTHATESYCDTSDDNYRSLDKSKNIVAIGDIVAKILNDSGIVTLHSTELYDEPDYNMSYYNASLAIRKYLEEYPSISYIIDIHRDSMMLSDGTYYAPTALIENSTEAAQMMFVVGTDHGGSGHTGWRDNLSLAARLQCLIKGDCPDLMRDINLRSASFNEQYTKGSLIIEIGSCASEFKEASLSAEIFARQLAREVIG